MKKIGSAALSCILCMFMALFSQAQSLPTIIAPTEVVKPYTVYKADIKVAHFKNIVGAQFTITWDSTVLKFRETKNFLFEETALTEAFGKNQVSKGILAFIWVDAQLQGRSLDDSTTLFSVEFDVIGTPDMVTPINFTDDVAAREIADTTREAIQAAFHNGAVTVMGETTNIYTYNNAPHKIQIRDSYPNPFHESTQIQFELKEATRARLVIYNIQGQTVYEEQRTFASGFNTLTLTKEMFLGAGTYQYALISTDFTVTQKLIFF